MSQHLRNNIILLVTLFAVSACIPTQAWALASSNIPLDSPTYAYQDKLAGFGLLPSEFKGMRPFSKAEAARLLMEAEKNLYADDEAAQARIVGEMIKELRHYLSRELSLRQEPAKSPWFDYNPLLSLKLRYAYLNGLPRGYERPVHDSGGDGVFGIGSGLRPDNPYPSPVRQHGSEGTPLLENNEGIVYRRGSNSELRFSCEAYAGQYAAMLLEPMVNYSQHAAISQVWLNTRYYLRLNLLANCQVFNYK